MDFARSECCKWPCIIRLGIYPSRNPPTNSFEEAYISAPKGVAVPGIPPDRAIVTPGPRGKRKTRREIACLAAEARRVY